jgi:hypothetical protein
MWLGNAMRALQGPPGPVTGCPPGPLHLRNPCCAPICAPAWVVPLSSIAKIKSSAPPGIGPCCELVRQAFPDHQIELWRPGAAGWPGYILNRLEAA